MLRVVAEPTRRCFCFGPDSPILLAAVCMRARCQQNEELWSWQKVYDSRRLSYNTEFVRSFFDLFFPNKILEQNSGVGSWIDPIFIGQLPLCTRRTFQDMRGWFL